MGDRNWLGVKEVAAELHVHYITALELIHRGLLRATRVGRRWRVSREELERFKREGNYTPEEQEERALTGR